jgi:hypothetical protein
MSYKPTYNSGQWIVLCDICGGKYKANELRQRWDGFMVCDRDFEQRHPQDFVRGVADFQAPFFTRPEPQDTFIGICEPNGITSIVDYAVAGCAVVDFRSVMFDPTIEPPPCNSIYYLVDSDVPYYSFDWACTSIVVDDAALTIQGRIGIY